MANKKTIDIEIAELNILKIISRAYAQIASIRIRNMRNTVLISRDYLQEINQVFESVLESYYKEAQRIANKSRKKGTKITFLSHNGRNVAVFLSANSRLYGDLIVRTFRAFLDFAHKNDVEVTIIGKYGLALFEEEESSKPFTYFDFPDTKADPKLIASITNHLVQYDEIHFFYPEFQNAILQKPQSLTLSSGTSLAGKKEVSKMKYLFEPSLEAILGFFESQIFSSLMEQTIQESQLAKYASRVLSMDGASQKITDELKKLNLEKLKIMHQRANKKQLEIITGVVSRI